MKPELKTRILEVKFWTCKDDKHYHTSEMAALRCIRETDKSIYLEKKREALALRVELAFALHYLDKQEFTVIGKRLNVTWQGAQYITQLLRLRYRLLGSNSCNQLFNYAKSIANDYRNHRKSTT